MRALKGIRMRGEISLLANGKTVRAESGEILFGEGTVSGIAAMQLARDANLCLARGEKCAVRLNFLPDAAADEIDARAARLPRRTMEDFLSGYVPKRLGQTLVKAAGVPLLVESPTNQQFPILPQKALDRLGEKFGFEYWQNMGDGLSAVRFCTSWATTDEAVAALIDAISKL